MSSSKVWVLYVDQCAGDVIEVYRDQQKAYERAANFVDDWIQYTEDEGPQHTASVLLEAGHNAHAIDIFKKWLKDLEYKPWVYYDVGHIWVEEAELYE